MKGLPEYISSSQTPEWETPQALFNKLDQEFQFTLDPCASDTNHKCLRYFTKAHNGLVQDWHPATVFMNPPYGREIADWVRKAYEESRKGAFVVALLPCRTDTRWWHEYVMRAKEVRFIKGRIKFGGAPAGAPFPSCIVIWYPQTQEWLLAPYTIFRSWSP